MSPTAKDLDGVIDYVMASDNRVRQALMIVASGREIHRRIIATFLKRLEKQLSSVFDKRWPDGSWQVSGSVPEEVFAPYWYFRVAKKEWGDLYGVCLGPEKKDAQGFIMGVNQNLKNLQVPIDGDSIFQAVVKGYLRTGRTNKNWPFWVNAEQFGDWNRSDVLLDLHSGKGALEYFTNGLIGIAKAAEPALDEAVSKYRSGGSTLVP